MAGKLSLEVFPPKPTDGIEHIYECLDGLAKLEPTFISVTYNAGVAVSGLTSEVCKAIITRYGIPSVAHLTCAGATKDSIQKQLLIFKNAGIKNILALRGDLSPEKQLIDYSYATDLMKDINDYGGFTLLGSCYPEGHLESSSPEKDIEVMKLKDDLGVKTFLSQLFFDNSKFLHMVDIARSIGVKGEIEAGIMPITSAKSLKRMVGLCGASITKEVEKFVEKYEDDNESLTKAGIEFAIEQIRYLMDNGCDAIHLYAMNNVSVASGIVEGVKDII